MKRIAALSSLVVAALAGSATPGEAWHGGWHRHHHGPHFHARPAWWGPPPYWRVYHVYGPPPAVVVEPPPVYVQQPAAPTPPGHWHYCASANAYYPNVATCAEPWVKVPPRE